MTALRLGLEGVTASTALGHALLAGAPSGDDAIATVIGPAVADPVEAARAAIGAGRSVLIEPVARCGADGLREVAAVAERAEVTAAVAFRRRFEPDLAWARASVAAGTIGLPWGIHAETLAATGVDPLTEALDLLDAISFAAGLRAVEVVRLAGPEQGGVSGAGTTIVLSVGLDHGGVGQVIARLASRPDDATFGPELASFRITGSHGTILGDLDGPALGRHPDRLDVAGVVPERVDPDGTRRLLDAFTAAADGAASGSPAPSSLVGLGAAADLLALIQPRTRSRRRT